MKNRSNCINPAEAGYYTTRQWDQAFQGAFETLQSDRSAKEQMLTLIKKTNNQHQRTTVNKSGGNRW